MAGSHDPGIDRIAATVRAMVEIMRHGNWPPVDLADERAVLTDAGIGAIGVGEASGNGRARKAAMLAVADLMRQRDNRA